MNNEGLGQELSSEVLAKCMEGLVQSLVLGWRRLPKLSFKKGKGYTKSVTLCPLIITEN